MWYWIVRAAYSVLLKSFFGLKAEGLENLPKKNNFIIVANHCSFLDPLVVGAVIPKKIYCIALSDLYRVAWLRWLLPKLGVLPTGSSSQKAVNLLLQGKNVGLFPEGRRSRDGKLGEFRKGTALLAMKTGRQVVPCAILGTYQSLPVGAKFPKFVPLKVKIGKPIYLLKEFKNVIDDDYLREGIIKIRRAIEEMLSAG